MVTEQRTDEQYAALLRLAEGPYEAFLYDCDGTLADNMEAHKEAYRKVAREQYGFELDAAIVDELAGWPTVEVAAEIARRYGVSFDPAAFATEKSRVFNEEFIPETQPIEFVVRHLREHAGKQKIGVVSGGSRHTVPKTLKVLGIDGLIDVLVCAGDTEKGKPDPAPFLLAAQKLGVRPEACLVFEDGDPGIKAAGAAGMKWIRIDRI